jgi:hypothetical protein
MALHEEDEEFEIESRATRPHTQKKCLAMATLVRESAFTRAWCHLQDHAPATKAFASNRVRRKMYESRSGTRREQFLGD